MTKACLTRWNGWKKCVFPTRGLGRTFSTHKKNGHSIFLCALENGVVAGYISADAVLETAYINNVAVDPLFRKRGTALSLIAALEERAKEKGCLELTLEVRSGNIPAKKLYEKCGFVPVGVRRGYYSDPTDDAVIMTKRLQA